MFSNRLDKVNCKLISSYFQSTEMCAFETHCTLTGTESESRATPLRCYQCEGEISQEGNIHWKRIQPINMHGIHHTTSRKYSMPLEVLTIYAYR